MRPEDQLLLTCTRQHLLSGHMKRMTELCERTPIRWDYVYKTARMHGVEPLIASNLLACRASGLHIPDRVVERLEMCREQNSEAHKTRRQKLSRALSYFHSHSIKIMLVKHAALNTLVYRDAWYTTTEDMDVIIGASDNELIRTNDKEITDLFHPMITHHYYEHRDINLNGRLPIDFQRLWKNAVKINHAGHEVFVLSPEDMLIATCVESFRKRFFMLKNMCDVAEMISNYRALNIDLGKMARMAREYNCQNIVYTALIIAKNFLGSNVPDGLLTRLCVRPYKARLIHSLIRSLSLSSLADLYAGREILAKILSPSVLLPDTRRHWGQIREKVMDVWESMERIRGWLPSSPKPVAPSRDTLTLLPR